MRQVVLEDEKVSINNVRGNKYYGVEFLDGRRSLIMETNKGCYKVLGPGISHAAMSVGWELQDIVRNALKGGASAFESDTYKELLIWVAESL